MRSLQPKLPLLCRMPAVQWTEHWKAQDSLLCSLLVPALQEESAPTAACKDHARLVKAVWPKPSREASEAYIRKRQVRIAMSPAQTLYGVVTTHRRFDR